MEQEQAFAIDAVVPEDAVRGNVAARRWGQIVKRTMDIACSAVALVLLLPVFVIVAILIKLDSAGPVAFKQRRIGWHGRKFTMWKFRTMCVDADSELHRQAVARAVNSP